MMRLGSKGLMGLASAGMLSALNRPSYAEGSSKYGQISPARIEAGRKAISALDTAKAQEGVTRKTVDLAIKRSKDPSMLTTIGSQNLAYWYNGAKDCSNLTKKCADARGALESKEHRIGAKELTKLFIELEDLEDKSESLTKSSQEVASNTRVMALGTAAVVTTGLVAAGVYSGVFAKMYAGLGTSAASSAAAGAAQKAEEKAVALPKEESNQTLAEQAVGDMASIAVDQTAEAANRALRLAAAEKRLAASGVEEGPTLAEQAVGDMASIAVDQTAEAANRALRLAAAEKRLAAAEKRLLK
jgi:hypothetical protein